MSLQARMVVAGISAPAAIAINGTTQKSLTATGSTQATALPLPADICRFTTAAAGTGAIIQNANPGDSGSIQNLGANAVLIYPPVGGTINALGVNAGYSLAAGSSLDWYAFDALTLMMSQAT